MITGRITANIIAIIELETEKIIHNRASPKHVMPIVFCVKFAKRSRKLTMNQISILRDEGKSFTGGVSFYFVVGFAESSVETA